MPMQNRRRGRCSQCGKDCALAFNDKPWPHKSGNPDDWYEPRGPIDRPQDWCKGESVQAVLAGEES